MIVEEAIVVALQAGLAPAPPVYLGALPQPDGNKPVPLPGVVVQRIASGWNSTFCGTDLTMSVVSVQIDFYARAGDLSRRYADQARSVIAELGMRPSLQNEFSLYEPGDRAWRVVQTWLATDYAPSI